MRHQDGVMRAHAFLLGLLAASCGSPSSIHTSAEPGSVEIETGSENLEGVARGFPAMRDLAGKTLAAGEFTQRLEGDRLHVRIRYDFGPDRWVEETAVIRQRPKLVQERWSWTESRGGLVHRRFEIDFLEGLATAEKRHGDEVRRWSEPVDAAPGVAFAGSAWALAIRGLRDRLLAGETIALRTVGFTPAPKAATVEITHDGVDRLPISGRSLLGDRFRIHPRIPWIARAFVDVPDSRIWLTSPAPAAFLRFEGPLAEPDDPIVRVDLLPGDPSGPAAPAKP